MKDILKRIGRSFMISSLCGLVVNLLIDVCVNGAGNSGFCSISPEFAALFPTPVIATYINVLLYGVIGACFSGMTFIYDISRIGFAVQSMIYFAATSAVFAPIIMLLWQLYRYPQALVSTLCGYALTYLIMGIFEYRKLKEDIRSINEALDARI